MIKRLLALAAALALSGCGSPEPQAGGPAPALWEVSDSEGRKGWLFGTVHALPDGLAWQTPLMLSTLDASGVLVVEVSDIGATRMAQQAFTAIAATRGLPPLPERVDPEHRPALAEALAEADMAETDFSTTETWAAALMIANAQRTGEVENGVDRALLTRGLPVMSLESFAQQFALFDTLAEEDQRVLLEDAALNSDPARERALVDAWAKGDLAALEAAMKDGFLTDPELREALLVRRNNAWLGQVTALVGNDRKPFVAVGAGHLVGPAGLPALLEARGFTLKRLQ
jgi:uncharacterized protein YbaP (TraB family)